MSSSAQATDSSAFPMFAASFLVMIVTESFGTRGSVLLLSPALTLITLALIA
jgi:uncharacterized membrane protein YadS